MTSQAHDCAPRLNMVRQLCRADRGHKRKLENLLLMLERGLLWLAGTRHTIGVVETGRNGRSTPVAFTAPVAEPESAVTCILATELLS